ncbi:MAG: hypothetical protein IPM35_02960 [Myxococcales bacterium]|nr:hypothetical protein [Myxococcales bacterium]
MLARVSLKQAGLLLLALLACNSSAQKPAEDPEPAPPPQRTAAPIVQQEYTPPPATTEPAPAATGAVATESDAPEISRSAGVAGGAVVLWPRIVLPRDAGKPDLETLKLAARAQSRLADVARKVLGNVTVDMRPEPERVCPKQGCKGISLGLLFAKAGGGCSLFALVGAPGTSPQRIVPWSPGAVKLSQDSVGFREPAEKVVKVTDYAQCAKLPDDLAGKDSDVEAAIRSAAGK